MTSQSAPVRMLTIDGGGVRGIIPAMVLTEIEKRTQKCAAELFDKMGAKSTGSILALGLSVPSEENDKKSMYRAKEIVEFYETNASKVFKVGWWNWFTTFDGLNGPKDDTEKLRKVLSDYFHETLAKDSLTEFVIPTKEITESKRWYFQRKICRKDPSLRDFTMTQLLLCSTAAVTYFPPQQLKINNKDYAFVDGGIFANNPTEETYKESDEPESCVIVSLGTGKCDCKIDYSKAKKWGPVGWLTTGNLLGMMMNDQMELVDKNMQKLFPGKGKDKTYFRWQTEVDPKHSALNDGSKQNIEYLKKRGEEMIKKYDEEINQVCQLLEN